MADLDGFGDEQSAFNTTAPNQRAGFGNPSMNDGFGSRGGANANYNDAVDVDGSDDGIQESNGGDFWNQDFGGNNNNSNFNEPNIQDDHYGGGMGGGYQVMEVKQNKPKIGQAFDAPLTPEEEARIAEIENDQRARMHRLQDKEANEIVEKRDKQDKAREELKEWYEDKERERLAKSKQNKEEEWAFMKTRDEHKHSKNPWEKIIDNVEINQNKYLGTRDVTRMRQAMIARKADIKSQGNDLGL